MWAKINKVIYNCLFDMQLTCWPGWSPLSVRLDRKL